MTLAPRSLAELQEAVGSSRPRPLRIRGGGSKRVAARDGTTLDTRGLTGIVAYTAAECVVTVLAGTPVRDVQRILAEHGQYLPFDPPLPRAGATIGGTVAAGLSGSCRLRYGGIRDFVIGAAVVDGDGRLIRSGGQVVKNAAGFLLHHALVGSAGRYGVVGEVAFKVFPSPEARCTVRVGCASLADALERQRRLRDALPELDALDVDLTAATVWARVAGPPAALPARLERARVAVAGAAVAVLEGDDDRAHWADAAELSWASPAAAVIKVPTTPGRLPALAGPLVTLGHTRAVAAGSAVLVATSHPLDQVQAALETHASRAVVVRGADCGRLLGGRGPAGATAFTAGAQLFDERVRRALDPAGRFA